MCPDIEFGENSDDATRRNSRHTSRPIANQAGESFSPEACKLLRVILPEERGAAVGMSAALVASKICSRKVRSESVLLCLGMKEFECVLVMAVGGKV